MPNRYGLSDTELEIMEMIWSSKCPIYFNQILDFFNNNGKDWKKQTLHTHLSRLIEKGALDCKNEGRKKAYFPKLTREQLTQRYAKSFLNNPFNCSLNLFLSALTGNKKDCTQEELDELRDFLNKD